MTLSPFTFSSLRFFRVSSNFLTASGEYRRSPQCRQTSALTLIRAVFFPPRKSFSTTFKATSPPHTGHLGKCSFIFFVSVRYSKSTTKIIPSNLRQLQIGRSLSPNAPNGLFCHRSLCKPPLFL